MRLTDWAEVGLRDSLDCLVLRRRGEEVRGAGREAQVREGQRVALGHLKLHSTSQVKNTAECCNLKRKCLKIIAVFTLGLRVSRQCATMLWFDKLHATVEQSDDLARCITYLMLYITHMTVNIRQPRVRRSLGPLARMCKCSFASFQGIPLLTHSCPHSISPIPLHLPGLARPAARTR